MEMTAWGKYPTIEAQIHAPQTPSAIERLMQSPDGGFTGIARGLGRSYGDSSLAATMIDTRYLDHFLSFDSESGLLRCAAGVSLADILELYVPQGWFLPVTPGTKFVTIAGAIAADVHGKNHHIDGTISNHIVSLAIMLASGEVLECSREQHSDLFRATCAGMGLTGIILEATLRMRPVKSALVNQTTIKAANLAEAIGLFEEHRATTHSVAWIDCLSSGKQLGRSLLMLGEHADHGPLEAGKPASLSIPVDLPGALLNRFSIQAFNTLYYHRVRQQCSRSTLHYEPFFYPLDGIAQWNRMYGKKGFTQYQFVLPREAGIEGMSAILKRIAKSRRGSFLAVLKAFGPANDNYLSFPIEGYTLALDFKLDKNLFALLDELDQMVLNYDGRIYLAKDCRMSEATFKQCYPNWEAFQAVRRQYGATPHFQSLQAERLGLH
jgi:decaprenylphospho-beta-D-ribofuranose 2-oxidase